MRGTGIGTSLMLIAIGAILAFAVNFDTGGSLDINAIGGILMVVGLIGLVFSFVALGGFGTERSVHTTSHVDAPVTTTEHVVTRPTEETVVRREERVTRQ